MRHPAAHPEGQMRPRHPHRRAIPNVSTASEASPQPSSLDLQLSPESEAVVATRQQTVRPWQLAAIKVSDARPTSAPIAAQMQQWSSHDGDARSTSVAQATGLMTVPTVPAGLACYSLLVKPFAPMRNARRKRCCPSTPSRSARRHRRLGPPPAHASPHARNQAPLRSPPHPQPRPFRRETSDPMAHTLPPAEPQPSSFDAHHPPEKQSSTTACTAAFVCPPVPPTSSGARRWIPRAAAST